MEHLLTRRENAQWFTILFELFVCLNYCVNNYPLVLFVCLKLSIMMYVKNYE
jgi:hypothetical protein